MKTILLAGWLLALLVPVAFAGGSGPMTPATLEDVETEESTDPETGEEFRARPLAVGRGGLCPECVRKLQPAVEPGRREGEPVTGPNTCTSCQNSSTPYQICETCSRAARQCMECQRSADEWLRTEPLRYWSPACATCQKARGPLDCPSAPRPCSNCKKRETVERTCMECARRTGSCMVCGNTLGPEDEMELPAPQDPFVDPPDNFPVQSP